MAFLLKFKKSLASLLLAAILLPLTSFPAYAYSTPDDTYLFQFENAVFRTDEMNLQSFVFETVKAVAVSATISPLIGCLSCPRDANGRIADGGIVGTVSNIATGIYAHPPASGVQYVAQAVKKFNIVPTAWAQQGGEGFSHFQQTLLPIWRAFRDASYLFFVIIMIFMGFAIMFRIKISPQAIISIQSALPKVILAIVLITFSYAIVGFMIDVMLVVNNIVIVTFTRILYDTFPPIIALVIHTPLAAISWTRVPVTTTTGFMTIVTLVSLPPLFIIFFTIAIVLILTNVVSAVITLGVSTPLLVVSLIFLAIIAIVLIIVFLRLLWTLLMAYAQIVLGLIFAPFQILMGVLPGSKAIGSWFRNMISNLAVLPTVLVMVFLAGYLTFAALYFNFQSVGAGPTLLELVIRLATLRSASRDDLIDAIIATVEGQAENSISLTILLFVAIVILFITPRVADMIKAFVSGQPFGYGAALTQSVTPPGMNFAKANAIQLGYTGTGALKGMMAPGTRPERFFGGIQSLFKSLGGRSP